MRKIMGIFIILMVLSIAFNYGMDVLLGIELDNTLVNLLHFFKGLPLSEAVFSVIFFSMFIWHIRALHLKQKN
jgi:uncharacterized protein YqhQ